MKCNFCGLEDNEIIFKYTRFEKNNILKCKNCRLVFLELKKSKKETELFYEKSYQKVGTLPKKSAEEMFNDPIKKYDCENRIEWIKKKYGNIYEKKILEIGSSSGFFLEYLSSFGAKAIGVELNEDYANYARGLGFTVYSEPFETINSENEFDLVIMFHTLEHIFDPMSILHHIYISLKMGGVFMGEVPNQNDWRLKIFNNEVVKRFHYDNNHYYYFSPKTLYNYFKRCGFNEVTLETVERYNSLIQLKRILCGEHNKDSIEKILKRDIFAKLKKDIRIPHSNNFQETEFNKLFEKSVNGELMGNCIRWIAIKG